MRPMDVSLSEKEEATKWTDRRSDSRETRKLQHQILESQNRMATGIESMRDLLETQFNKYQQDRDTLIGKSFA